VVTAVAALEASINEFYLQAVDRKGDAFEGLTKEQTQRLQALWPTFGRTRRILDKYQDGLEACDEDRFQEGGNDFQPVAGLVRLRNALLHFKPEWRDEPGTHGDLERELRPRFRENALVPKDSDMPWFPRRCLGAECARWTCKTVDDFAKMFAAQLGVRSRF
jgi:hypothetical protein